MTDRAQLIQNYIKVQKDLAAQKETLLRKQAERDETKKAVDRTENYIKNLESIGNPVGYILQKINDEKIIVKAASGELEQARGPQCQHGQDRSRAYSNMDDAREAR